MEYVFAHPEACAQNLRVELHAVERTNLQQPAQCLVFAVFDKLLEKRFDLRRGKAGKLSRERSDVRHAGAGETYGVQQLFRDLSTHPGTPFGQETRRIAFMTAQAFSTDH